VTSESDIALAPLATLESWAIASSRERGAAIKAVAGRLGSAYEKLSQKTFSCDRSFRMGRFRHIPSQVEFLLVPGGTLVPGEAERKLSVSPFLLGRFEVTELEWNRVSGSSKRRSSYKSWPKTKISWAAANVWLTKAGDGFRFPTVEEWEFACRAGTSERYYWGDEEDREKCDDFREAYVGVDISGWGTKDFAYDDEDRCHTHTVYCHRGLTNNFGFVNMLCNVSEWCSDQDKGERIWCGGWDDSENSLSSCELRGSLSEDRPANDLGLRVALSISEC
jgi:formylglycine-generating enzyme required for sulfatase activity